MLEKLIQFLQDVSDKYKIDKQQLWNIWNEQICSKFAYQYYKLFCDQCQLINSLNKFTTKKNRRPNFPELVSETIVRKLIGGCIPKTGDCIHEGKRKEIKCFASTGPISFGPNEEWDEIIFVDAINHPKIKIYECKLSNRSNEWQQIKVNKTNTFKEQCDQNRRPRITFKMLKPQIPLTLLSETTIEKVLK